MNEANPRAASNRYEYPFLECDRHTAVEPGYVVCMHLFNSPDTQIGYTEAATAHHAGVIICSQCEKFRPPMNKNNFRIVCAGCCRDKGWIK